jgi:hypothetical protein
MLVPENQAGADATRAPYTCPCCGYRVFEQAPGSYDICHVCFWEDDPAQLLDPWYAGGANAPSLAEAQVNNQRIGACNPRCIELVDGAQLGDKRDSEWRMVSDADHPFVRRPADLSYAEW